MFIYKSICFLNIQIHTTGPPFAIIQPGNRRYYSGSFMISYELYRSDSLMEYNKDEGACILQIF